MVLVSLLYSFEANLYSRIRDLANFVEGRESRQTRGNYIFLKTLGFANGLRKII